MVIPVGPGKFYGSSLPRPRYFVTGSDRVDPPVPVLDPLLSWAAEAHWSMGGLSSTRLRLQGRIEGSVSKLRLQRENTAASDGVSGEPELEARSGVSKNRDGSVSPPPAPVAVKRRRFMTLLDEDEEEDEIEKKGEHRRLLVRNLGDDFDRVASESPVWPAERTARSSSVQTRSRRSEPAKDLESGKKRKISLSGDSSPASSTRSSPRLAKRGSTQ